MNCKSRKVPVVLKLPSSELDEKNAETKVQKTERDVMAKLKFHPNVVHVLAETRRDMPPDQWRDKWVPGLGVVMQYCELGSLENYQDQVRGRLKGLELFSFAFWLADSLAALHRFGIVHRDLKRNNVLVCKTRDGKPFVKLADFGIASVSRMGVPQSTQGGLVGGCEIYRSPELFDRERKSTYGSSPARDVHAYGSVLFEMATNRLITSGVAEHDLKDKYYRTGQRPDAETAVRFPEWEKDGVPEWARTLARMCWEPDPERRVAQFVCEKCPMPMDGVVRWLCGKNVEEAREAMLQQCLFSCYEAEHPFLDGVQGT